MSSSESENYLSSEGEETNIKNIDIDEEEESDYEMTAEERELCFNMCDYDEKDMFGDAENRTSQKKIRVRNKKEPKNKSFMQFMKDEEEKKKRSNRTWKSSRIRRRKKREGKEVDDDEKPVNLRRFKPRDMPGPPPMVYQSLKNTKNVDLNDDDNFPTL